MDETKELILVTESAIPAREIDENRFIAKSLETYLIVFIDIVDSTSKLDEINDDIEKVTKFFGMFNQESISNFRLTVSRDFKFKMMGDGLLFFVPIKTQVRQFLDYKSKCDEFNQILNSRFPIRTVAGKGKLIEFDVGISNGWTDYYGVRINDIVHASKNMIRGEFKWI